MVGDPRFLPHPVEAIGQLIQFLRRKIESFAGENTFSLRLGGTFITLFVISLSCGSGWIIEQFFFKGHYLSIPNQIRYIILVLALASSLAARSLSQAISNVLSSLNDDLPYEDLSLARKELSHIVGRDVENLSKKDILRATAESASENAVDGIFAPLFWMIIGTFLWSNSTTLPGPLAMAWLFKASSTIDSMLGYKIGKLRWLGESGAKLDDVLTFIPCRLVLLTLPLISKNWIKAPSIIRAAWKDGVNDISPNSGLSEAIFAYCADIRMGGVNKYKSHYISKPILALQAPPASKESIKKILKLYPRLEIFWISIMISIHMIIQ